MNDVLDVLMTEVLAKMSVISEQRARSYDGVQVHGGEKVGLQPLLEKPLVDFFRERFNRAHSLSSRRQVVLDALEALKVARRMPIPVGQPPALGDPQWKRWVIESGLSTAELVRMFSVSRQYLHQVRRDYLSERQV